MFKVLLKRKSFLRTHSKAQVVSHVGLIPLVENKPKVPGLPQTGTFGEDGSLRRSFSTGTKGKTYVPDGVITR